MGERERVDKLSNIKKEVERTKKAIDEARARYNLARLAELEYQVLPSLEEELARLTAESDQDLSSDSVTSLLTETITPDQIADVVSRWTGIPVAKRTKLTVTSFSSSMRLSTSEWLAKMKPLRLWLKLFCALVPACPTNNNPRDPSSSLVQLAWVRPNWPRPWLKSCSMMSAKLFVSICLSTWRSIAFPD